ncbi:MAG TPA: hypothetical protein VN920_14880 [Pyrinomonadaceae bacterium]|nr:hypothetical protein [Pyrinomonadaceae bacterium]
MLEDQKAEAQQVLNELHEEGLTPFQLNVGSMLDQGSSKYSVHFHDSRIHSVEFCWQEGESFQQIFRTAVLERVDRMSGRLHKRSKETST